jgi:hypothetical protein
MDDNELLEIMKAIVAELDAADDNSFPSKIQNAIERLAKVARSRWAALGRNDLYPSSMPVWREVREVLSRAVRLMNPNEATSWWLESLCTKLENIAFLAGLATKPDCLANRKIILITLQELIAQARAQNNDDYDALRLLAHIVSPPPVPERDIPEQWDISGGMGP